MLECVILLPSRPHSPGTDKHKHPFFWEMSCSGTDSQMSYRCTRMDEALLVIAHAAGYRWGGGGYLFVNTAD